MTKEEFDNKLPFLIESFWGENPPTYSVQTEVVYYRPESGGRRRERMSMWVNGYSGNLIWRETWQEVFDDFQLAGEEVFWKAVNKDVL